MENLTLMIKKIAVINELKLWFKFNYQKLYYINNKTRITEVKKLWRKNNPTQYKNYYKKYYRENKDMYREHFKRYNSTRERRQRANKLLYDNELGNNKLKVVKKNITISF